MRSVILPHHIVAKPNVIFRYYDGVNIIVYLLSVLHNWGGFS